MRLRSRTLLCLLTAALAWPTGSAAPASAAAGEPVRGFGQSGTMYDANVGCETERIIGVLPVARGGVVVASVADCRTSEYVQVVRYTATGALDPTFSGDGRLLVPAQLWRETGAVVDAGSDGYFVVSTTWGGVRIFRVSAAGALVTSFGRGGVLSSGVGDGDARVLDAVPTEAGGLRLVVTTANDGGTHLLQLLADGSRDPAFGEAGTARLDTGSSGVPDAAVLTVGSVVTVGKATASAPTRDVAVRRYDSAGQADPTFSGDGLEVVPGARLNAPADVEVAPDGAVYAAYARPTSTARVTTLAVTRLGPTGGVDSTYGNGGTATKALGGDDRVADLLVDSTGQLDVLVSRVWDDHVRVARLTAAGRPDYAFGDAGLASMRLRLDVMPKALVQLSDSDLLVASETCCEQYSPDIALSRIRATTPYPETFVSTASKRLLDTRLGGRAVSAGTERAVRVLGAAGVPASGVSAVVVNVTVVSPTANGYATVFPTGRARPVVSTVNFAAGQTIANLTTVRVGDGGAITTYVYGARSHLVIDVVGYYSDGTAPLAGSRFVPGTPQRVLDTRPGRLAGDGADRAVGPGGEISVRAAGVAGVPADAYAVVLTVTAVTPSSSGYVTAWTDGVRPAAASNINFARRTASNLVIVRVAPTGTIRLFNSAGTTHLVADVAGYYVTEPEGRTFRPLSPRRAYDSRRDAAGKVGAETTRTISLSGRGIPPSPGVAAVLNVTVTGATTPSYITVHRAGAARPVASNVNVVPGQTVAIAVVTELDDAGSLAVFNAAGTVHVVVDLAGWFTPPV